MDDVFQTLVAFHRLLNPQGRLLLTTPNLNYLRLKLLGESVLGGAHLSRTDPLVLKHQLEKVWI